MKRQQLAALANGVGWVRLCSACGCPRAAIVALKWAAIMTS